MSKTTAAATKAKFASKTEAVEVKQPEFQVAARADGTPAHNLEWMTVGGYIYLRINLAAPTIPSSKGNPLVSTSRGFIGVGGMNLSLNALPIKK